MERTDGLRKAFVISAWVTVLVAVGRIPLAVSRRSTWEQFLDGNRDLDDLQRADDAASMARAAFAIALIVAGVLVAVWTSRIIHNARSRGVQGLNPGLSTWGWLIPIANVFVPFTALKKCMVTFGRATTSVIYWQVAFGFCIGVGFFARGSGVLDESATSAEITRALENDIPIAILGAVVLAAAAWTGNRATIDIDAAVNQPLGVAS